MKQVPETFPDNFLWGGAFAACQCEGEYDKRRDAACPQVTFMSIQRLKPCQNRKRGRWNAC